MEPFCRVAVDSPVSALDRPFDYAIPERLIGKVQVGSVVRVVLHGRSMRAYVTELIDAPAVPDPRPLRSLVSAQQLFGPREVELARWVAERYVAPLGLVFHDAVPGRFSAPRLTRRPEAKTADRVPRPRWLSRSVVLPPASGRRACVLPPTVNEEPELAAHVAEESEASGRTLIVCPRVELAESIASQISDAAVLHGAERPAERASAWAAARDGAVRVLIGGRSALLAPLPDLRTVCVVSAHDRSLKSERAPRLHGLVVARRRAEQLGAAFIASSPAPPLEVTSGDDVEWIEGQKSHVRAEVGRPRGGPVTPRLIETVRWATGRGMDALVFVGRKGNVLRIRCRDCGWTPSCPTCGAGLAPGTTREQLACRVCGESSAMPTVCGSCGGSLVEGGWGHERVAKALERADVGSVVRIVRGSVPPVRRHPAVVVGTLAAAHVVSQVGCVCVADLDQLLARPDFRAAEHALQTLHELAGVLAPGGRFFLQTREPDHHAVQAFTRQSYRYFFDREMPIRKQTMYPPFGAVVRVETVEQDFEELERDMRAAGGDVIGAVPRRGRLNALVRASELQQLVQPLRRFAAAHSRTRVDVDPVEVI